MSIVQDKKSLQSTYHKKSLPEKNPKSYEPKTFQQNPDFTTIACAGTKPPLGQAPTQKEVKTFRDLAIWQKGLALVKNIYAASGEFPRSEFYGLVMQMRRAAVSIPSNISEGYRRRHSKEFQQFLNISLGSLGELETQLIIASELGYLANDRNDQLLEQVDHLVRMIISLSKKVDR